MQDGDDIQSADYGRERQRPDRSDSILKETLGQQENDAAETQRGQNDDRHKRLV